MRFACQSCGKAYSLPEERIADKSNVKLKCRVCGAIVEVKKQGELVAQLLDEVDGRRVTRVSEAPAPLNSLTPEDDEADGATVSISEGSLNNGGPLQFEMPSMQLAPPPTGFTAPSVGMPPAALPPGALPGGLSASAAALPPPLAEASVGADAPKGAAPLGPPPLSPSSLPPPPPLRADAPAELSAGGASNGRSEFFGEDVRPGLERKAPDLLAPVAPAALDAGGNMAGGNMVGGNVAAMSPGPVGSASVNSGLAMPGAPGLVSPGVSDLSESMPGEVKDPMFKAKMLAAFATGIVVDRIIAGLFQ